MHRIRRRGTWWLVGMLLAVLLLPGCRTTSPVTEDALSVSGASVVPLDHLPALRGGYFKHASQAVGRDFHVYVRLPEGYDPAGTQRYPVVYLLDGDSLFPMLASAHLFLHYDEKLPEAIIVGIAYGGFDPSINKRDIDFNAAADDGKPGQDGAPRFLRFLEDELLPTVESRYRVDPTRRVLVGQSRSGYFVLWSALEAPDLFWGRIASNPSSTPGRGRFFEAAATHQRDDLSVAVAIGSRDTDFRKQFVQAWTDHWQSRDGAPWQVRRFPIENGTHAASIGEVYRQAMLWLFREESAAGTKPAGTDH